MATAAAPPFEAPAAASPTSSAAASSSSSQAAPSSSSTFFRSSYPATSAMQPQPTPSTPASPLSQSSGRLTARESALLSIRMQQWLQTTKHELSREEKNGFVSSSKRALVHAGLCGLCAAAAASRCSPSLGVRLLSFGAATSVASSVLLPIYRRRQWERLLLQQPHTPFTAAAAQALSDIRSRAAPSRFLPPSPPLLPLQQQQQLLLSRQSIGAGVFAECASRVAGAGEAESSSFVAAGAAASSSASSPSPLHPPSPSHVTDAAAASPSPSSSGGARGAAAAAAGSWDTRSTSGTSSEERDENSSNRSSWFPGEAAAAQEGGDEEERDEEAAEVNGWKQPDALDAWQAFRVSGAPESRACAKCYQQHQRNPKHAVESRTEGHSAPPAPVYRTWEDVRKEAASASTGAAYPYSTTLQQQQQWSHEVHNEQQQQRQFPHLQQASPQQQQAPAFAEYRTWADVRRAAAVEEEEEHGGTRRQQQRNNSWDRVRSMN